MRRARVLAASQPLKHGKPVYVDALQQITNIIYSRITCAAPDEDDYYLVDISTDVMLLHAQIVSTRISIPLASKSTATSYA